jgi:hypothetical protein
MANLWDEVNIYMCVYVCVCVCVGGGEGGAGGWTIEWRDS